MRSKLSSAFLCFVAVCILAAAIPCYAADNNKDTVVEAESFLGGILSYNGAENAQEWIGTLSQNAGDGSEWYVIGLAQYGEYDFSSYESALLTYLKENKVGSASSRLKFALCLAAMGSNDEYIASTLNDSIGKQGLMSWVFGLHLINNKIKCDAYSATDVTSKLISLQCADGGFAIMGQNGDVDSTAMTLQALAPYYDSAPAVKSSIDKALAFLSEKQLEGGDYASYGVPNPESCAQVLVALSALGIDAASDERFIKSGAGLFDGIKKYRLADGSFCHNEGGESNGIATVQTFYALIAYLRFSEGKASLYLLDSVYATEEETAVATEEEKTVIPDETTEIPDETTEIPDEATVSVPETTEEVTTAVTEAEVSSDVPQGENEALGYKPMACAIVIALGIAVSIILIILKKKHFKNYIAILIVCALAIAVICLTDFRSAEDYYNGSKITKENAIGKVTLTIRCDTVAGRAEHIPDDGIILDVTEFPIADGDSVYTILTEAARIYGIQLENDGDVTYVYISGINYLYEFDYGDLSGWMYKVNGEPPSVGAGEYKLRDGDVIEWHYTTNLGEDLK